MFGFLKKKLSEVVDSISGKVKKKSEEKKEEQPQEPVEQQEARIEEGAPKILEEPRVPELEKEIEKKEPELKPDIILEKVEEPALKPEKKRDKKSFFKRITEKVVKKIVEKRLSAEDVGPMLVDIENSLIEADVAVEVAEKLKNDLKNALVDREIKRGKEKEIVVETFRKSLMEILDVPKLDLKSFAKQKKPIVLLFLGFNGGGKTTTMAKIGKWLIDRGYSIAFAAGDTWRKAAIEQLEEHAKRLGANIIKHKYGADPAAVIYDGVEHCRAKGINFLLADTAGRTHTNKDLIEELKKVVRVNKPDFKILVMDSLVGNDAVPQSQMFNDAIGIDAVIFTKLDVNEKGGAILSVTYLLKKPILFLGTGQSYIDLVTFDSSKFVEELLRE